MSKVQIGRAERHRKVGREGGNMQFPCLVLFIPVSDMCQQRGKALTMFTVTCLALPWAGPFSLHDTLITG